MSFFFVLIHYIGMSSNKYPTIYITGNRGSGKTTLCKKLITEMNSKYNEILIFKGTHDLEEYDEILDEHTHIYFYDPDLIRHAIDCQKKRESSLLLVLDDCIYILQKDDKALYEEVFFNGRHFKTSLIMLSQGFKKINNDMRNNINFYFFLKMIDENFFKWFNTMVNTDGNKTRIIEFMKSCEHPCVYYNTFNGQVKYM